MKRLLFNRLQIITIVGAMAGNSGCVALNLPSDRYQDPADHGGLLGSWKTADASPPASGDSETYCDETGTPVDQGALVVDPFDTESGEFADAKKDEIPWPRFHPIPTRPIYGNYR
jgi:hypothetical protein